MPDILASRQRVRKTLSCQVLMMLASKTQYKREIKTFYYIVVDDANNAEGEIAVKKEEEANDRKPLPLPPTHVEHDYDDDSSDSSDSSSSSSSSDSDSDDSSDDSSDDDSRSRRSSNYRSSTATKTLRQYSPNGADSDSRVEPKAYRKEPSPHDARRVGTSSREDYSRSNKYNSSRGSLGKDEMNSPASTTSSRRTESPSYSSSSRGRDTSRDRRSAVHSRSPSRESPRYSRTESSSRGSSNTTNNKAVSGVSSSSAPPPPSSSRNDTLMDLLRRFPVMWQGLLGLKNETAAVQMHFLSGWLNLFYFCSL